MGSTYSELQASTLSLLVLLPLLYISFFLTSPLHLLQPDDQEEEEAHHPRPHRTPAPGPPPGVPQETQATDRATTRKNPSARGREDGKENVGNTLPARRRRIAWTLDGKQSPSPPLATRRAVASTRVARIGYGHTRVRLHSGPTRGRKARIDPF